MLTFGLKFDMNAFTMNEPLKTLLLNQARQLISDEDPSHDFLHALRVLANAERLMVAEGGDPDVIIPSALFHDVVNYPKNDPRAAMASDESAEKTANTLAAIAEFPAEKIPTVAEAIRKCSYSKNLAPVCIEEAITQDADMLDCGAIGLARLFCSSGQLHRVFYSQEDPFADHGRERNPRRYTLDSIYTRLLPCEERMRTKTGRVLMASRLSFVRAFIEQFRRELEGED